MAKRWTWGYLIALSIALSLLVLTACAPIGLRQSVAPQHTLARDGGTRLTLRATCLPSAPSCDVTKQRVAAIRVLSARLAGRSDVQDPVVRADGSANIVVELPGITGETQIADITSLLTKNGAVAILDTGSDFLDVGTSVVGKTCTSTCNVGQYRILFTGDQIDRNQVAAVVDQQSGKWVVEFAFAGSARQQFAQYTATHIGQYLTIAANDVVVNSATIQSEIDGPGQITGTSQAEAKQMAAYLKSGSLPATLTVVSTEMATPSAG